MVKRINEIGESFDQLSGDMHSLKAQFARLDQDVDEHLEQASSKLKRAATRESNMRRAAGPAEDPNSSNGSDVGPSLAQQFAAAEAENWSE